MCSYPINDIVLLQDHNTLLLTKDTVYSCDIRQDDLKHRAVVSNVIQISLISTWGNVLSLDYRVYLGTYPAYSSYSSDITVDHRSHILSAIPNDNAIYLRGTSLTFQKLSMTEEDGLQRPTIVAVDAEGYLYVGCENGRIHVVIIILNTNRLKRLNIEKRMRLRYKLSFKLIKFASSF